MRTSRAALARLLDADNTSVTLQTMSRAAAGIGEGIVDYAEGCGSNFCDRALEAATQTVTGSCNFI